MVSEQTKQTRLDFIAYLVSRINNVPEYTSFYSNAFCVLADVGLQNIAKEEGFFTDEWKTSKTQEMQLKELTAFLYKHIK
ncbi:MAG: hypothetical protein ACFFDF_06890 [Candidatus Odinarchaeota archaeon]